MKFGSVESIEGIDLKLPADHADTKKVLGGKEAKKMEVSVGCAKWNKTDLKNFYPKGTKDELEYYSRQFNSIELNGTFYSLKSPAAFQRWYDETPSGFVFAIKGSRFITHNLKLRNAETALANFLASGVLALGRKTGPFLWQLPAIYRYDRERMDAFMRSLPRTSRAAESIALRHDERLRRGALVDAVASVRYRHAFEVRHPSYFVPEFYDLLRAEGHALVVADTAGRFPFVEEQTADFTYVRLHGATELYASRYEDEELETWARRIAGWTRDGRDAYVYFDNDAKVHAPHDAQRLMRRLGS